MPALATQRLGVMIVDDFAFYRRLLADTVSATQLADRCETASNGRAAMDKLRAAPADLVLLDVEMPEMDGLETLDAIRREFPDTAVIMVSAANRRSANITIEALERGAIDFIPKPDGATPEENLKELRRQLQPHLETLAARVSCRQARRISADTATIARSRPVPAPRPAPAPAPSDAGAAAATPSTPKARTPLRVCVVASSTGGPNALAEVLPGLPADFPLPVLLVQHMPPLFTQSLADSLSRRCPLPVLEAQDGQPIRPGQVLLAPGGRHMTARCAPGNTFTVGLTEGPLENGCRPAADVLFRSVAATFGEGGILAAVLTGMGRDGCEGVRAMKRRGCYCLTQSAQTCVVYGMPQAVDEQGLSDERLDIGAMAARIRELAERRQP